MKHETIEAIRNQVDQYGMARATFAFAFAVTSIFRTSGRRRSV